ncbi:MAG: hypothetical protein PHX34_03000 [Candidatus Shapirobacteria bacterium]|nr:hypothetical protein [Candidatus Shapirobacteria bacterium]
MPVNISEREGELFDESVIFDGFGGISGRVCGDLGNGRARLYTGEEEIAGTLNLIPTKDSSRRTRTWVFDSLDGRVNKLFVSEEGLKTSKKIS